MHFIKAVSGQPSSLRNILWQDMDLINYIFPFYFSDYWQKLFHLMLSWLVLIFVMPPTGPKRSTHSLKATSSPKQALKSKKKRSEDTAPEVIDITKQGSGEANIELRDFVLHGENSPVVELDNIHSTEGGGDMPPPDAPGHIIPTYAPDKETRVAAEVLEMLQKQQWTAGLPKGSGLSTPPGEADYSKGGGLMKTVRQSVMRQKMCSMPVSQPSTPTTPAGLISTITVGVLPPARVLAEDLTKATLRQGSPNLLKMASKGVGKQTTSESTDSHSKGEWGGTKGNQGSSTKPGVLTAHSSAPGCSGGAAGGSSQDPNEPRQEVSRLALVINDDVFADDPNQIIPTKDAFALPFLPRQGMEGFDRGYLLPAEVTAFWGIYYYESGDVRPGYTGASPWDFPLDRQGHMASKLHSGVAAYSLYIWACFHRDSLSPTRGSWHSDWPVQLLRHHWDSTTSCQSWYLGLFALSPSGIKRFLGSIWFRKILLPSDWWQVWLWCNWFTGINMYQMYIVALMVKGGMHYVGVALIYKPHGLFAGNVKRCATFLRTFFNRCESEIDVAPSQAFFLWKRRGVGPLSPHAILDLCQHPHSLSRCNWPGRSWYSWFSFFTSQSPSEWWSWQLVSSMALRRGHMYSYHWSSSTVETLGLFEGQCFSLTLVGYGSGSRWQVIT